MTMHTRHNCTVLIGSSLALLIVLSLVMLTGLGGRLNPGATMAAQNLAGASVGDVPRAGGIDPATAGTISATLGEDDASYHLIRGAEAVTGVNRAHGLGLAFTAAGLRVSSEEHDFGLELVAAGREGTRRPVAETMPSISLNRIEYDRGDLLEWYVNGPAGVQQGFTLDAAPAGPPTSPVTLDLRFSEGLGASVDASGSSLTLRSDQGGPSLHYRYLTAFDADGRRLPAHLEVAARDIRLVVDDRGATYPIVIDPFIQTNALHTENGYGNGFGVSVAIDGDTMVVGAQEGDTSRFGQCGSPMVYVYVRSGSPLWNLVARLTSSRPERCFTERFGHSVAISGDWIAVGDPWDYYFDPDADPNDPKDGDWMAQGSVFMFRKPAGGWQDATETQVFTEYDGTRPGYFGDYDDAFGVAVALEGDTLVVGASAFDWGGLKDSGAVFVYQNPGDTGWEKVARLTPSDPQALARFGMGLGYSNGTIVVGNFSMFLGPLGGFYAPTGLPAAVYVFDEPLDGWRDTPEETARLTVEGSADNAVAIEGDTVVVGSPILQQAFVFVKPVGGWVDAAPDARLVPDTIWPNGEYGNAVAIEGDTVVVAAEAANTVAGEAYIFKRPEGGWTTPDPDDPDPLEVTSTARLRQEDPDPYDYFGWAVKMDGGTIVIGAFWEPHWNWELNQENPAAGSVYVFGESDDVVPPTTMFTRDPVVPSGDNGWDRPPVTVTLTADDGPGGSGIAQIRCKLDSAPPPATFLDLPDAPCPYADADGAPISLEGTHTLYAASIDNAGNRSMVTTLVMKIDGTPPRSNIVLDPAEPNGPDGTYSGPVSVLLGFGDEPEGSGWAEVRCVLDPANAPTSFDDLPTTLCGNDFFTGTGRRFDQDGSHTIWNAVRDRAGNKSLTSKSFTIRRKPTVSLALSPATPDGGAGWYRTGVRVTVTGASADGTPAASIRCVLDPATAPTSFGQLPASCPYLGAGALVSASGRHTIYAASIDASNNASDVRSAAFNIDSTPPVLTCEGTGPARFTIGEADGTITASVSDPLSGPVEPTASATLSASNLSSVGQRTIAVTALDVAGNQGTVNCAYVVGYDVQIDTPTPGATFKAGATVAVTFSLSDADGNPISDSTAATLAGGKRTACYIDALLDDTLQRGCPTYSTSTQQFTFAVKTPKGRNVVGIHDIAIQVRAPNGSGVINVERVAIQLTP